MPEATYTAPPTTHVVPPDAPSTSEASITISAIEFRAIVHTFQTLTTTHTTLFQHMAAMRAQQDQHTAILRQIHQHLGLLLPPQPDIPGPLEPIAPVEETIPTEETTRAMSRSSPLRRPPYRHHLLMILPLLDHLFILYLLIILVDIITCFDVLYSGIGCIT